MGRKDLCSNKPSRQFSYPWSLRPSGLDILLLWAQRGERSLWVTVCAPGRLPAWLLGAWEAFMCHEQCSGVGRLQANLPKPDLLPPVPAGLEGWPLRPASGYKFCLGFTYHKCCVCIGSEKSGCPPIHPCMPPSILSFNYNLFIWIKVKLFELCSSQAFSYALGLQMRDKQRS